MRKAKRIVALVLALTMMFALMAMTASAATARSLQCQNCGSMNTTQYTYTVVANSVYVSSCNKVPNSSHYHITYQPMKKVTCKDCGVSTTYYTGEPYTVCNG